MLPASLDRWPSASFGPDAYDVTRFRGRVGAMGGGTRPGTPLPFGRGLAVSEHAYTPSLYRWARWGAGCSRSRSVLGMSAKLYRGWTGALVVVVTLVLVLSMLVPATAFVGPSTPGRSAAPAPVRTSAPVRASRLSSPTPTASPLSAGPHPGSLDIYEVGSQTSEDPAVAYDTISAEPIYNVYQTLIAYNGTSTGQFVPELSTCVPGAADGTQSSSSVSCQSVYGSSLIVNNSLGQPEYWTYPIDPAARFYDPSTGASWPVFPSDVMFSFARTEGFANLPGVGVDPGWIQTQALDAYGNGSWDGGIHSPYNNTPQGILGSMLVNDSTYCPAAALAANGCITFNATGEGSVWPFFNQLMADGLGASIVPCGWFTYIGASVPGFSGTTAPRGDGPCLLPGGATSTGQAAFQSYLSSTNPTAWDSFEGLANNHPSVQPAVQFDLVGSGPYYIPPGDDVPTSFYLMFSNPAYRQPTGCAGVGGGCEPAPGQYASEVTVHYETNPTPGLEQYIAGQADSATSYSSNTSTLAQLRSLGAIGISSAPSLDLYFLPYDLNWNRSAEASLDPNASSITISTDFFASNTVRNLLNHAWPYATAESSIWTTDGIQYGVNYGGAIPRGMGNYYPTNISWPYLGGDPGTNTSVNSAAWWWSQGTNASSPYYDPELASCTPSTPCVFPLFGSLGSSMNVGILDLIAEVETITGGALKPYLVQISFTQAVVGSFSPPGQNPLTVSTEGWAPDYPDPTDYVAPLYYADSTYTYGDSVREVLETNSSYNSASCGHTSGSFSDLTYWANYLSTFGVPIPSSCQGPAYGAMLTWLSTAAPLPVGPYRVLIYNEVEHVENQLGLYLYAEQGNQVQTYAKWIDPSSINSNPMIGGAGDQLWFEWADVSQVSNVTFQETGLPAGTEWQATLAGVSHLALNSSSFTVSGVTAGTYPYSIGFVPGYTVSPANGSLTVSSTPGTMTISVVFTAFSGGSPLNFTETGLVSGTAWTVVLPGVGAITTDQPNQSLTLPASGSPYSYAVAIEPSYAASPSSGAASTGSTVALAFTGLLYTTYSITFVPSGGSGQPWSALFNGFSLTSTTGGNLTFYASFGYYSYAITPPGGLVAVPSGGTLFVNNTPLVVSVAFEPQFAVTFTEQGLAPGTSWSIYLGGLYVPSSGPTIIFTVPNGTYGYQVNAVFGYSVVGNSTGNVTVTGGAVGVPVSFQPQIPALGVLLELYGTRPDLQAAFPGASLGNITDLSALVSWAADVANGRFSDSAANALQAADAGPYYTLMGLYNSRPDLQSAFPNAYTNVSSYESLVAWAGSVVTGTFADSANSTLRPWGYSYVLDMLYLQRPDLQAAFLNPLLNSSASDALISWAAGVVTGSIPDTSNATLQRYGYFYDLMGLYNSRPDLEAAFPHADSNASEFASLVGWAGAVVNGTVLDSARTQLAPFGYWYVLLGVYNGRPDLQAAFPLAYVNATSYQSLLGWAKAVVTGAISDSAYSTLQPYAATYEALG